MNFYFGFRDLNTTIAFQNQKGDEPSSKFDKRLQASWMNALRAGSFKYVLNISKLKVLPGIYSFFAQLNEDRATKRRTPQHITSMSQSFNPNDFNFRKVNRREVMFYLVRAGSSYSTSPDVLLINVSPLEFGHSLLIPQIDDCLPQVLTAKSICLALEVLMLSSGPFLRVGFNSLLGYASVNHLHFHVYYLRQRMLLERIPVKHLAGACFELTDYPALGFVFQLISKFDLKKTAIQISKLTGMLQSFSVAHNVYMTRGTKLHVTEVDGQVEYDAVRIYVWARTSSAGAKETTAFNPALCELFGHLNIKDNDFFDKLDERQVSQILSETCNETFYSVREHVKRMYEKGAL